MKALRLATLIVTGFLILSGALAHADNWPQWRGAAGDGISKETGLPAKWSATENLLWKLKLPGMGSSTPAVWGNRLFLTSEDKNAVVLLCVSTDGKELWRRPLGTIKGSRYRGDEGNESSPSPCTDGKHVFVFAGSGDLACFDLDGKEIWHFNVQDRYGRFRNMFGMHSTPVLHGDRLYLTLLHAGKNPSAPNSAKARPAHFVVALDKATGKEVWKIERKDDAEDECEQAYTSPFLYQNGQVAYLVVHGNDYCTAHRLDDGSEIWRVTELNPSESYNRTLRFVASPLASPDLIVIPSAKNGCVVGLKPDAKGTVAPGSAYERWRMPKGTPDVPSPLVHDGLVYLCRENGVLICLDAKTGKVLYNERTHESRHRASPVYADGKIYLTAKDGVVSVVKAGPKFELLATNRLPDAINASPAISNGKIFLRGYETLYAIGAPPKS